MHSKKNSIQKFHEFYMLERHLKYSSNLYEKPIESLTIIPDTINGSTMVLKEETKANVYFLSFFLLVN